MTKTFLPNYAISSMVVVAVDSKCIASSLLKWKGKTNGELLGLMTLHGFDVLVTMDRNLQHQQNLSRFSLAIILIKAKDNKPERLKPLLERVNQHLKSGIKPGLTIIEE